MPRIRSRNQPINFNWGLGQEYLSGKDLSVIAKWKDAKHAARDAKDADEAGDGSLADVDRFAARYYAGTFDEELNKLAVDTTTLWQGYYPSLYNPHTQEAAAHIAAPTQTRIDPITGEIIEEPEPPPPPAPAPAAPPPRIKYGKGKAKRRGEEWYPGIYGYPVPGNERWGGGAHVTSNIPSTPSTLAATGIEDFNVSTGAPRPEVNPNGELIPWQYANWVISMGQWRGT